MNGTHNRVRVFGVRTSHDKMLFTELLYNELSDCSYVGESRVPVRWQAAVDDPRFENGIKFCVLYVPTARTEEVITLLKQRSDNEFIAEIWYSDDQ